MLSKLPKVTQQVNVEARFARKQPVPGAPNLTSALPSLYFCNTRNGIRLCSHGLGNRELFTSINNLGGE